MESFLSRDVSPVVALGVGGLAGLVPLSSIPELWFVSVLGIIGVGIWLGRHVERWKACGVSIVALAGVAWFGLAAQPVGWRPTIAVAAVALWVGSRINETVRQVAAAGRETSAEMARQARTDGLTELANRSHYVDQLRRHLIEGQPLAVMVMDLNRFKVINDTLGHAVGDEVLIHVARRVRGVVPDTDVVARLGGDEFAIISCSAAGDAEAATALAERIGSAVSHTIRLADMSISTSMSIGVALAPQHGEDVQSLMRQADIAMYEAKRRGVTVELFSAAIEQTPIEEVTLSAELANALRTDQFVLVYQPKVELATGRITGFEALARWNHPTLGVIGPDRFIHLVTLSDHAMAFADRIIEVGITFAAACRAAGHPLPIAVNLSTRSLFDTGLPERTARSLQRHELEPDQLIIELTEADIMDRVGDSSRVLQRLSDLGVRVSVDDFGTGYSSLARLVDLPISEVKIDRRFVSRAVNDPRDEIVVRSIIELAQTLDLHIVAEGVEQSSEVGLLLNAGCDEAQGFLFSPPLAQPAALEMLDHVFPIAYRAAGRAASELPH